MIIRLKTRLYLAQWLPPLTGICAGGIMAWLHLRQGFYSVASLHFILWGLSCQYGTYIRDLLRKISGASVSKFTPSWTSTLILQLLFSAGLFLISNISNSFSWLYFVLAINITYLGAKLKCYVYRCCDVKFVNLKRYPFVTCRLPVLEMGFTLFILFVLVVLLVVLPPNNLIAIILFFCHIFLRYLCSLLRFTDRNLVNSFADYTILAPSVLFVILVW